MYNSPTGKLARAQVEAYSSCAGLHGRHFVEVITTSQGSNYQGILLE